MNFKSKGAYQNWLGYVHATGLAERTPGNQPVSIKGKEHDVQHGFGGALFAAGGSFNNPGFNALPVNVQNQIKTNSFAAGGPMDQLTEFNAGGSHEENPLGGIPQGVSPDGQLNLTEQNETKRNRTDSGEGDYVYSDRIKVAKNTAEMFGLPKTFVDKTFAAASKLANRTNSRRENDTIEQQDTERKLTQLQDAQEAQKAEMKQKETADQLAANPELLDALTQQLAANQSVQPMGIPQGQPVDPNQLPPEMVAQMEGAAQGQPIMACGGHMYMCGGKMYDFGGFVDNNSAGLAGAGTGALSGAGIGAKIGSVVPGIGTAIGAGAGAVIGGVSGFFKGHEEDKAKEDAKQAAQQQQLAQGEQMNYMPNAPYLTPAVANTMSTPFYAEGGPLYHEYPQLTPMWKNNAGPMGQGLANTQVYGMGGHMYDIGGNMFTRQLANGGPDDEDFNQWLSSQEDKYKGNTNPATASSNLDDVYVDQYGMSPEETAASFNTTTTDTSSKDDASELENLQVGLANAETDEEFNALMEKYKSALERLNTGMTDQNMDLTIKAHPLEAAAMALPAAYNIGMGLFGKASQLNAEDYKNKNFITPYLYDINPALRTADQRFAQSAEALRNAGISGGNYASNMQALVNQQNAADAALYADKYNKDAETNMKAQMYNSQLAGQNNAMDMQIADYNARAKAAKQGLLGTGLSQVAHIGDAFLNMKKDAVLAKAMAPDFANSLKLLLGQQNKNTSGSTLEGQ